VNSFFPLYYLGHHFLWLIISYRSSFSLYSLGNSY
jgi:hypothetical protein